MELFYGGLNSLRYSPHHSQIKEKAKVKTAFSKAFLFLSFSLCFFLRKMIAKDERSGINYQGVPRGLSCTIPFIEMTRKWFISEMTQFRVWKYTWPLGLFNFLYFLWPFTKKVLKCSAPLPFFTAGGQKGPNDNFPMCLGYFQVCGLFSLGEMKRWYVISTPSHHIKYFKKQRNIIRFPV